MNFVTIDFETATAHHICAVGIVTVINGTITDTFYTLVQPPDNHYNWHNIQVHNITPNDTYNAPLFYEIYPEIKKRIQGKLIVAHNESFDRNVLKKSMADNSIDYEELKISDRWECTMKLCRKSNKYPSGKLNECCALEGIKLNHHEALSDAIACAKLYLLNN